MKGVLGGGGGGGGWVLMEQMSHADHFTSCWPRDRQTSHSSHLLLWWRYYIGAGVARRWSIWSLLQLKDGQRLWGLLSPSDTDKQSEPQTDLKNKTKEEKRIFNWRLIVFLDSSISALCLSIRALLLSPWWTCRGIESGKKLPFSIYSSLLIYSEQQNSLNTAK